jgi:hypothetical protein
MGDEWLIHAENLAFGKPDTQGFKLLKGQNQDFVDVAGIHVRYGHLLVRYHHRDWRAVLVPERPEKGADHHRVAKRGRIQQNPAWATDMLAQLAKQIEAFFKDALPFAGESHAGNFQETCS